MRRRQFITIAAMGGLGGCAGLGSNSSPNPAQGGESATATPTPEGPIRAEVGEPITRQEMAALEVSDVRLSRRLEFTDGSTTRPNQDSVFLIADFRFENTGNTDLASPSFESMVLVTDGSQYDPVVTTSMQDSALSVSDPLSKQAYRGGQSVYPGVTKEGYLLFEVPEQTTDVQLSVDPTAEDGRRATWAGTVDPDQLPEFEIRSVTVPETHPNGQPLEFEMTVRNSGGREGVFAREVRADRSGAGRTLEAEISKSIPADDTVEISGFVDAPVTETITLVLDPDHRQEVKIVPAKRTFGQRFTTQSGVNIDIGSPTVVESVTTDKGGDTLEYSRQGYDFSIHDISAWNPTNSEHTEPDMGWFEVEVDGFISDSPNRTFDQGLVNPVEGGFYRGWKKQSLRPGESSGGYLFYNVPEGTVPGEVTFRYKQPVGTNRYQICEWRVGGSA
jgi:hypothetical protein